MTQLEHKQARIRCTTGLCLILHPRPLTSAICPLSSIPCALPSDLGIDAPRGEMQPERREQQAHRQE